MLAVVCLFTMAALEASRLRPPPGLGQRACQTTDVALALIHLEDGWIHQELLLLRLFLLIQQSSSQQPPHLSPVGSPAQTQTHQPCRRIQSLLPAAQNHVSPTSRAEGPDGQGTFTFACPGAHFCSFSLPTCWWGPS